MIKRAENEVVVGRCKPRIGFLGNPSDGYKGRCVSFPIDFFEKEVSIEARAFVRKSDGDLQILPNRVKDSLHYKGWNNMSSKFKNEGYYGGIRLVQAALTKFHSIVSKDRLDHIFLNEFIFNFF